MATIAEQLTSLSNTKTAIKDAIVAKGVAVADTDPFSAYPTKIGQISGGGGATTKFGVSIDNLIGDISNGAYQPPVGGISINLSGATSMTGRLSYKAYGTIGDVSLIADDIVVVDSGFNNFCEGALGTKLTVHFNGATKVTGSPFLGFARDAKFEQVDISFANVETIDGYGSFQNFFSSTNTSTATLNLDKIFPKLKYISGNSALNGFCPKTMLENGRITLSKVETIIGATSNTLATFAYISADIYLPSCTLVENYICRTSNTNTLHFAAANQAAIEACTGYANKFGADEIYFDL